MSDLTLICEICLFPVAAGTGALYVRFRDITAAQAAARGQEHLDESVTPVSLDWDAIRWRAGHYAHPEVGESACYAIDAARISTWRQVAHWTAHLMEKDWLGLSDWDDLLRELAGDIPPRLFRTGTREAA